MKVTVAYSTGTSRTPASVSWGWAHILHPEPSCMEIHIMPLSDVGDHAFDVACACGCQEDDIAPGFYAHRAFDGREAYETGARKHH